MKQDDIFPGFATSLEMILKQGAQKLLQQAIETEVAEYLELHQARGADNRRVVKRNGYLPERNLANRSRINPEDIIKKFPETNDYKYHTMFHGRAISIKNAAERAKFCEAILCKQFLFLEASFCNVS